MATIHALPPEILTQVFGYLAGPAPSERRLHDQPSDTLLDLDTQSQSLKSVSLVDAKWRLAVLPLLFRNVLWRPGNTPSDASHLDPAPLLQFLLDHRLEHYVTTFTMMVDSVHMEADARHLPHQIPPSDLEHLWSRLFSVLDPLRFTLISPPTTLAALLNRMLFMDDAWQFGVPYHILSLARCAAPQSVERPEGVGRAERAGSSAPVITTSPCRSRKPAPPCPLFTLRPWSSILLNEGSSIRVYEQYEFFLRSPPSILGALLGFEEYPNNEPLLPPTVTDLNYIAIFPLSSHFSTLTHHIPQIDRLFIQLEPRPHNRVLQDQETLRHVDIRDLWMELTSSYNAALRQLFLSEQSAEFAFDVATPHWDTLKVFEIGDTNRGVSWEMVKNRVCGPGLGRWRIMTKGVLIKSGEVQAEHYGVAEQHTLIEESLNGQVISVPPPVAIDVPTS